MTAQFARTPYRGRSGGSSVQEPHAALLIDFDNVTMGIRSDLTKELKNLLNSDIIKGKVAVQRAYADWRRYPQYIVPLAESSVDLIFAPAYGSAKKNATDIRLAIDAVELVFTRPEIGTIILLSGDSDFSSLVLKLKEYGKYVIGVGIRESASDLLVQNCDEYYSYSALTGLTRAGDEAPVSEDPWELVELGLRQMIENNDVMRSDRLKQVLLERDSTFDEKALGFQKFNKFLQEAANRGIISLRKQENGQYEVGPPSDEAVEFAAEQARGEGREGRSRRGRRGRGRREERESRPPRDQLELPSSDEPETPPADAEETAGAPTAVDAAEPEEQTAAPSRTGQRGGRATRATADDAPATGTAAPQVEADTTDTSDAPGAKTRERATEAADGPPRRSSSGRPAAAGGQTDGIAAAHDLLRRAVSDLTRKSGPAVRDSDVKRRMLELQSGWDEASLGFSKFSRFLRNAHDSEVVTLRKGDNGVYDVLLGDGGVQVDESREERGGGRRDRGGRGGRGRETRERRDTVTSSDGAGEEAAATQATQPASAAAGTAASAAAGTGAPAAAGTTAPATASQAGGSKGARETQATAPAGTQPPAAAQPAAPVGFRRGSRGRASAGGPPPLLEGQTAVISRRPDAAAATASTPVASSEPSQAASAGKSAEPPTTGKTPAPREQAEKRSGQKQATTPAGRGKRGRDEAPAKRPGSAAPAAAPGRSDRPAEKPAAKKAGSPPLRVDPAALGLPTDADQIASYMVSSYSGVGPKSVQSLLDALGAGRIYDALETQQERVREILGARAERLLDQWADDIAARRANAAPDSRSVIAKQATKAAGGPRKGAGARKGGGRRGPPTSGRKPGPRK
ncbi:hypothetical protein BH23GEM9_BH23GEM9_35710 [soil metagenome]